MNRLSLLLLAISGLVALSQQYSVGPKELAKSDWLKYFNSINEELSSKVTENSDLESLLAAARELSIPESKSKFNLVFSSKRTYSSDKKTVYETFHKFVSLATGSECPVGSYKLLRLIDEAMDDAALNADHPVRPIDRVVGHYALRAHKLCDGYNHVRYDRMFMNRAFTNINSRLQELPADVTDDLVVEHLKRLVGETKPNGMLRRALDQLLSLKGLGNPEEVDCSVEQYDILLATELGLEFSPVVQSKLWKFLSKFKRGRTEKCLPEILRKFSSVAESMDTDLLNFLTVIAVTNGYGMHRMKLSHGSYQELKAQLNEPAMIKILLPELDSTRLTSVSVGDQLGLNLQNALRVLVADDPEQLYLSRRYTDDWEYKLEFDGQKLRKVIQEHIVGPCKKADELLTPLMDLSRHEETLGLTFYREKRLQLVNQNADLLPYDFLQRAQLFCHKLTNQPGFMETLQGSMKLMYPRRPLHKRH